ncbi:hormogonium polysaccharide biosynthesis protein HpsA [Gloeocapsopsis dulcis]|uniref:Uncharacterized protein n=1 Tax=Gloeocapsopsis dulcis AAB1 = 1H9 TaxID=1433147 RepID=A0A6N8FV05_9CHRO|nr:hormogonium polysaccharide biosynthesis protein HpsA [Gloeocapsopsis dulcis]MUL36948.1 hypothetical protein [Gloeocapsopsis dulcis AAB1 = 1H9]WNN88764.1 hormogonium polysaccharide biosynthesis protein HpsA [Gloeocapsopsis dulcis]
MSTGKHNNAILSQLKQGQRLQPQRQWLLRSLIVMRQRTSTSGFVLPTVAMVSLVIVLLTTAILVRSFDRSRTASNLRVSEAALNAATPALDRARAKIDALLLDQTLPQVTPTDAELENALNRNSYTLGDETRLKLAQNITNRNQDNNLTTAWKFPVDTDGNGRFDSYTLYGIYFRSSTAEEARNPLQARTPPMQGELLGRECENLFNNSDRSLGDSGWYQSGEKLSKSFFIYTATVPITNPPNNNSYEAYRGNRSFYALEFQQDRNRVPLRNHAALFQNDLAITPDSSFRLNGRIATNGNLLVGSHNNETTRFYQVSSQYSCFYNEENGKITVGGNVGLGNAADTGDRTAINIDLFNGFANNPITTALDRNIKSTTTIGGEQVSYNDAAYNHRIALMKQTALDYHPNFERRNTINEIPPTVESVAAVRQYPPEVKAGFEAAIADSNNQRGSSLNAWDILGDQIETYLRNLTRRVPYAEVATSDRRSALEQYDFDDDGIDPNVFTRDTIEPLLEWREPTQTNTQLTLNQYNLPQTQPEKQQQEGKESFVGDRIAVGNNLPTFWKKTGNFFLGFNEKQLFANGVNWNNPNTQPRYRTTQTLPLPDKRILQRNGFWENAAAQQLSTTLTGAGGLRIITGAGIYDRAASFLPEPKLEEGVTQPPAFRTRSFSGDRNIVVWSDTLPMTGDAEASDKKGDLQMRATAVYHYIDSRYTGTDYIERTPTACISSYYDPTSATTARNLADLPDVSGVISGAQPANGRSNNGVVYPSPYNDIGAREAAINQFREQLNFQARLIFPNGRVVNQPLRDALVKIDDNRTRSLADNSAIDTAICAIRILDNSLSPVGNPIIPHGAIKEATFLDAREIKAIDKDKSLRNYDLELEKRQPLEVRVTDIDLGLLAETEIGNERNPQEYLLPNSGIIYASRDDALADLSDTSSEATLLSSNDFILDPTRRPNGIRLINGSNLARDENYREVEKGLTFVTNLPAYILGDFNLHQQPITRTPTEEFLERLTSNWTNFYTRNTNFDSNFACRKEQPGCGNNGDQWRPATIVSDAVTVLSNSFVDGFRNDGDYDLNNYIGNSVTTQRKKNGFVDNSFATSVNRQTDNRSRNSYLNNGVTPIQRRTNFPEYVMEICRKIPVSECKPNDWVVGYEGNKDLKAASLPEKAKAARLMAGTTARPALNPEDRRYPRRIAFQRNELGTLELSEFENVSTPIPIGINSADEVAFFPYNTYNSERPKSVNNALWFRTTSDPEQPDSAPSYQSDQPLAYTPNTQLISPSTPDIGAISLNLPENNPVSGYTICTMSGRYFKQYEFISGEALQVLPSECGTDARNQIQSVYEGLRNLNPDTDTTDDVVKVTPQGNYQPGQETIITANDSKSINIVDIGVERIPTNNTNATTIRLVGREDSIFIIRNTTGQLQFGTGGEDHHGVNIELVGVSPNNVFWVINGNLVTNQVADDKRHSLAGTFLNNNAGTPVLKNVEINGRLLGFQDDLPQKGENFTEGSKITAITSDEQPLLIPVLQVHSPNGSPGGSNLDRGSAELQDAWLQTPENDTTVNAVFVSGNSPSRPGEEPAGLQNFVRLLENWRNRTLNIKGSFIQLHHSAYATAPFAPILASKSTANDGSLSVFDYSFTQYRTNNGQFIGTLPYFATPNRQWRFDVALLSQSPDLFAQKFTQPQGTSANEFIREVNRDDPWIETLLCAAQGSGNNYTYAVDESDRPSNCPSLNAYRDTQTNLMP